MSTGYSTLYTLQKSHDKKESKRKKPEPFKIRCLTQGLGLYKIGPVSPDLKSILLLAQKPESAPNLYIMDISGFAIKRPLTNMAWGVYDPSWSPDGTSVVFSGSNETASFPDIYSINLEDNRIKQITRNRFADKEPVYTPDGKRILFTTDESPLPDAAFGILHIAAVPATGGKADYFMEDEGSSIHPSIAYDNKSVLIVKVDEYSGRHSLWQYDLQGKPQRSLTERKFARIHQYVQNPAAGTIILWAQEEPEQLDNLYILDLKSSQITAFPEPEMPKRTPAISPDGKLVAFIGGVLEGDHVLIFDTTTGEFKQLTIGGSDIHSPAFINDSKILFGGNRENERELYLIDLSAPTGEKETKSK